ncbi:hypothetical protein C8A03DRAFT_34629 [Achaetomium macrosporum]|uniref:Uncharacterized protein n=1 Tax=Achaetomium macrosporum TaxID=79813 RepID=A0AAN7HDF8_9PEZI|nr:hypothetical protein C8A03DRAFT_34629 [Achaetomium macrosporum]
MPRRKLFIYAQVAVLVLITLALYIQGDAATAAIWRSRDDEFPDVPANASLSGTELKAYVNAILDPNDTALPRLECPRADMKRYEYLQVPGPA